MEPPPNDPEDWSDEQWQDYLRDTADVVLADEQVAPEEGATGYRKLRSSVAGSVVGAGMMGLAQAIYGDKPKEEVVTEAEADDPEGDRSVFDPDDPSSATITLVAELPPDRPERG